MAKAKAAKAAGVMWLAAMAAKAKMAALAKWRNVAACQRIIALEISSSRSSGETWRNEYRQSISAA